MKNKQNRGFTLIEILIAMSVLLVGLVGILALFPVGLDATRKSIEESNAAMVAESAYASLRAAVKQMTGDNLTYFHDGMITTSTFNIAGLAVDQSIGVPKRSDKNTPTISLTTVVASADYRADDTNNDAFCPIAQGAVTGRAHNITPFATGGTSEEWLQLQQYSFNIEISRPNTNPRCLYDVTIRVRRGARLIKKFYTQIAMLAVTPP